MVKKRLISMLMAAVLLGSTATGGVPMVSYADQVQTQDTVHFKLGGYSHNKIVLPLNFEGGSYNNYNSRTIYIQADFLSDSDFNKWAAIMDSNKTQSYLNTNASITTANDKLKVATGNGNATVGYEGLSKDGSSVILSFTLYSTEVGAKGNVTFTMGDMSHTITVEDTIKEFNSSQGVTGAVTIEPSFGKIKQNTSMEIGISPSGVTVTGTTWSTSNPELLTVEDLGNGKARITALNYLAPIDKNENDVYVYAKSTLSNRRTIVSEATYQATEGDPSFTLANESDKAFTLQPNEEKRVNVKVQPSYATLGNGSVTVTSSNTAIANASFNYTNKQIVVKAGTMEGTADIEVKAQVNGISCPSFWLTVTMEDPSRRIEITHQGNEAGTIVLDLDQPDGKAAAFKLTPADATVTDVTWSAADPSMLEIIKQDDQTAVLAPKKAGKTTLRLEAKVNGSPRTAVCDIYVLTAPEVTLKVNGKQNDSLFLVPQGSAALSAESRDGYPEELKAESTFTWASDAESIASASNAARIKEEAIVKAGEEGTAAITVTVKTSIPGVNGSEKTSEKTLNVDVRDIALSACIDPADQLMKVGRSGFFIAKVYAENGQELPEEPRITDVTWSSDNRKAVTISTSKEPYIGIAKGMGEGTASIGADVSVLFGGRNQTLKASASNAAVTREKIPEFEFKKESVTVKAGADGEAAVIMATPSDADVRTVEWSVGDESIAEVDGNGLEGVITGKKAGTTSVSAVVSVYVNGEVQTISVKNLMKVTVTEDSLKVSITPAALKLKTGEGKELTLNYKASPSNADYRITDVTWESDHEEAALVEGDETGAIVTGQKAGEANITATVTVQINGKEVSYTETATVTVEKNPDENPEEAVKLAITPEQLSLKAGEAGELLITSDPAEAVESIAWASDNESVATVAPDGADSKKATVTGITQGTASVQAKVTIKTNKGTETRTLAAAITVTKKSSGSSGNSGSSGSSGSRINANTNDTLSGTWQRDSRGWWFNKSGGGYPASQWGRINQAWYYFGADGYMLTGWQFINGQWYYLTETEQGQGAMVTGWLLDPSSHRWFYLNTDGAMLTGWQLINDKWYYLNPISDGTRGAMAANTWIGEYYVNQDGVWVE